MKKEIIELFLAGLIAVAPLLWIEDFYYYNPVWWTVVLAWHLGIAWGKWRGRNK